LLWKISPGRFSIYSKRNIEKNMVKIYLNGEKNVNNILADKNPHDFNPTQTPLATTLSFLSNLLQYSAKNTF
jgi:hypothetical protein